MGGRGVSVERCREALEDLYARYNRREYVHPDPLEFLYAYPDVRDREVAGLVAATLALGRVAMILRNVRAVLDCLGPRPAQFLAGAADGALDGALADFRHRFFTGEDLAALLRAVRGVQARHGSLEASFAASLRKGDETILAALGGFVRELLAAGCGGCCRNFLPDPARRSACKRLNLYLRWMVRRDDVDPGGWDSVSPARLVVPLDVHMHRIAGAMGLTRSKVANLATAIEITAAFRRISPGDPVKYDFALTRLGIRTDTDPGGFLRRCRAGA
jgi:uncharacterized protein (TIGR02757 family)